MRNIRKRNIITRENPKSPIAEAFRTLRTNVQFSSIDKKINSIVFTSSGPGEGKSTVAVNTATTMAQADKKILLVDCDLRKPVVHTFFGILNARGLTNVLVEGVPLEDAIYKPDSNSNFHVLTAGPIPPNPAELLGSKSMKRFLRDAEIKYDTIILDSPPIGVVTDSAILSTIVDGTILVCAVGEADIEAAKDAKTLLEKVDANILGVILNKVPMNQGGYYKYHYHNYYSYYEG